MWAVVGLIMVLCGVAGLAVAIHRLESDMARAERRLNRLQGFQAVALRLADTRGRFRRNQQQIERAVDWGAGRMEKIHRRAAAHDDRDQTTAWPVYDRVRRINQSVGRGVSSWLAPRTGGRRDRPASDRDSPSEDKTDDTPRS